MPFPELRRRLVKFVPEADAVRENAALQHDQRNQHRVGAEKLGSTPATVKKDVDWLTANEGYERPAVIPKRG